MDEIQLNEEDVVFDEVVNEVSIIDDEQNRNQNLITLQTSSSNSNDNVNQFIQQTIKSPVSNSGQVTSIRNVTPNTKTTSTTNKQTSPNKIVNNIVLTPKNAAQLKKPTSANKNITIQQNKQQTINLSPTQSIQLNSNNQQQILTKVIMTTGGQQLLITSPVKQQSTTLANNLEKQQLIGIVPVSPKQISTTTANKTTSNISIRPKPSTTTTTAGNLTIQSPTNPNVDKPQYQIIRLVSATNNSNTPTSSTITTANLKQITTAGGQQKILIPTSNIKGLTNQPTAINASGQQFLMYTTPQLIQSTAITPQQSQKQVTFSPVTTGNQRQQTFVPILPNPSTVINNTATIATNKATTSKQNGPKASSTSSVNTSAQQLDDSTINQQNQSNTHSNLNTSAPSNRPRKPCNCTRSQCLKLYCDCFANGEFCSNCNCINCFNNLDHEENRQKAIKQCLERNPHAFHPKIGKGKTTAQEGIERRHTKGCNCRRSGCLKNYCECYEAKILCTDLCKCCACKNYEDSYERKSLMHLVDAVDIRSLHGTTSSNFGGKENDPLWSNEFRPKLPVPLISDRLLSCSFITNDLVDAATKCLIAQAEKSQKIGLNEEETEKLILEEFGNCLTSIIEVANKEKQKEK